MIGIQNLLFRYGEGEFRLDIQVLNVAAGERVAVVGPSGSGKTTLLNLVAGIARPQSGNIVTAGQELAALDDGATRNFRIRNIGLVFQEFELLEYLDVLDNVLLPYRINNSLELDSQVRQRATELLESVGIGDLRERLPDQLSQGEKQRVAVCRALLVKPPLLLADEPTGNLDPANKGRVLDILVDYATANDATLVTVTHDSNLLSRFERVIDFSDFLGPLEDDDTRWLDHADHLPAGRSQCRGRAERRTPECAGRGNTAARRGPGKSARTDIELAVFLAGYARADDIRRSHVD